MDNEGVIITPWDNMCVNNNINRTSELNCWIKGIIGVVMWFVLVGTCLHYSFRLENVQCYKNSMVNEAKLTGWVKPGEISQLNIWIWIL